MQVGKVRYDVCLSYSAYQNLKIKERRALQKEKEFTSREFKTKEEAEEFAEKERQRTGLKIVVQECYPIYGIL